MRKPVIAGNWKMNHNHIEGSDVFIELNDILKEENFTSNEVSAVIIPPFTAIRSISTAAEASGSLIAFGAQDISTHDSGAYTGEVSGEMLKALGVKYVLVGHSERREYHNDSDPAILTAKVKQVLKYGMTPIFCCGEALDVRQKKEHITFVQNQLKEVLGNFSTDEISQMVIAYEPIWAIGTGETATSDDAEEVCAAIRQWLNDNIDSQTAEKVRIQYGGSVKPDNAAEIMGKANIDGLLVGGASLKANDFAKIIQYGYEL